MWEFSNPVWCLYYTNLKFLILTIGTNTTVKPLKTGPFKMNVTDMCTVVLQKALKGASFCNTIVLHLSNYLPQNPQYVYFYGSIFRGFTVWQNSDIILCQIRDVALHNFTDVTDANWFVVFVCLKELYDWYKWIFSLLKGLIFLKI